MAEAAPTVLAFTLAPHNGVLPGWAGIHREVFHRCCVAGLVARAVTVWYDRACERVRIRVDGEREA